MPRATAIPALAAMSIGLPSRYAAGYKLLGDELSAWAAGRGGLLAWLGG